MQYILPVVGILSVLFIYSFIIAKRWQRIRYIKDQQTAELYRSKVVDVSEGMWWLLTITISFLSYMGFILLYTNTYDYYDKFEVKDAIFYGLIGWLVISFIGYRITRNRQVFSLKNFINSKFKKTTEDTYLEQEQQ